MATRADVLAMRRAGKTLQEIGDAIGVTRQRVHQMLRAPTSRYDQDPRDLFLADAAAGLISAVPRGDGFTAWAGENVRHIKYQAREDIGNALVADGLLRGGEPVPGTNAVLMRPALGLFP